MRQSPIFSLSLRERAGVRVLERVGLLGTRRGDVSVS
jgi:hypothetical protein